MISVETGLSTFYSVSLWKVVVLAVLCFLIGFLYVSPYRLGFGSFVDKVVMPYVSTVPRKLQVSHSLIDSFALLTYSLIDSLAMLTYSLIYVRTHLRTHSLTYSLIDVLAHWRTHSLTLRPTDSLFDWLTHSLTDWLTLWLAHSLFDWLTISLLDCLNHSMTTHSLFLGTNLLFYGLTRFFIDSLAFFIDSLYFTDSLTLLLTHSLLHWLTHKIIFPASKLIIPPPGRLYKLPIPRVHPRVGNKEPYISLYFSGALWRLCSSLRVQASHASIHRHVLLRRGGQEGTGINTRPDIILTAF